MTNKPRIHGNEEPLYTAADDAPEHGVIRHPSHVRVEADDVPSSAPRKPQRKADESKR